MRNRVGANGTIFRPDDEFYTGSSGSASNGWGTCGGGSGTPSLAYYDDSNLGNVLHHTTTGSEDSDGRFINGDYGNANNNLNDTVFSSSGRKHLWMGFKNANTRHLPPR